MQWCDIHCHLLPDVDDGPDTWDTVQHILEKQARDGVGKIFVTPHYRKDRYESPLSEILEKMDILRHMAKQYGIEVFPGCECFRSKMLASVEMKKPERRMNASRYVLVEFFVHDSFQTIWNQVYELMMHGYIPIIAHIERYSCCRNPDCVRELSRLGAKIQINTRTILGKSGKDGKTYSRHLMKEDLVDFIATDTHDPIYRPPNLKECMTYIRRKKGEEYIRKIFVDNPKLMLR